MRIVWKGFLLLFSFSRLSAGEMWLGKGTAGPPLHIHPQQQDVLELVSVKLKIYRNRNWEVIEGAHTGSFSPGKYKNTMLAAQQPMKVYMFLAATLGRVQGKKV